MWPQEALSGSRTVARRAAVFGHDDVRKGVAGTARTLLGKGRRGKFEDI
jgi:hypothetical protein